MVSDTELEKVVKILGKKDAKVVFFVGAGISTNCGIPDFRSPKTGLYSNLKKLNLPYPEAVFDIDYFRKYPKAFYTLAEEMLPGKYLPSKFHYFIRLCQEKKVLKRCYSQNIDTLERVAGIKEELVVEAHGSFAGNHCIDCHAEMDNDTWRKFLKKGVPRCPICKGYVKPDIVFFGEDLPKKFFDLWEEDSGDDFDLAIVAGTSLAVYPFATLPAEVPRKKTIRMLINKESCGDFKENPRKSDLLLLQDCDSAAEKMAELLGWTDDLEKLIAEGKAKQKKAKAETEPLESAEEKAKEVASKVAKEEKKELEKSDKDVDELAKAIGEIDIKK